VVLLLCTFIGVPLMVPSYAAGKFDTTIFLELSALHLAPRDPALWITVCACNCIGNATTTKPLTILLASIDCLHRLRGHL
jgi:hypothetical protein